MTEDPIISCPKCKQKAGELIMWGTTRIYYCSSCSHEWVPEKPKA